MELFGNTASILPTFYAEKYGRPSLTPEMYFRALLIGYFEGIGAERGIAWRLADSLALRRFVGITRRVPAGPLNGCECVRE